MHPSVSLSMTRVATALTVYGIETILSESSREYMLRKVAIPLIVYGIEIPLISV